MRLATTCAVFCEIAKQSSGLKNKRKSNYMRAGFVVLIGRSNAGKSTLINSLVGAKVAIVSPKPQTTRFAIHGIVHDPRGQIVFVDTPGVLERTRDAVSRTMSEHINAALAGIDAVVYVADPTRPIGAEEKRALK